jgi:hypothetical protein
MAATDYQRGYSKGYQRGRNGTWPDYVPPAVPCEIVDALRLALVNLRNAIDAQLAVFDEDDPLNLALSQHIDAATQALSRLTHYATTGDTKDA